MITTRGYWKSATVIAPAQVGNVLGFFDHAGILCREPPPTDTAQSGGPGDRITIERIADAEEKLTVTYLRRGCNSEGFWEDVEPFTELQEAIAQEPERDLIGFLTRHTRAAIRNTLGVNHLDPGTGLKITVLKHSPSKKVGLGLGSSASSAAVVLALDHLYGEPLRRQEERILEERGSSPHTRLQLMARGEKFLSGALFYDNVAPLAVEGGLLHIDEHPDGSPLISPLPWPRNLWFVTITPDFSLETRRMREILQGRTIDRLAASRAAQDRAEVMRGLYENDVERVIQFATDGIIEPLRWPLILGHEPIRQHVQQRRREGHRLGLGISGSGPTVYALADGKGAADRIGREIHDLWKKQGIKSWWFVHGRNRQGARVG